MGWAAHFSLWPNTPKGLAGPTWPNYCSIHVGPKETTGCAIVSTVVPAHLDLSNITFSFFLFSFYYVSDVYNAHFNNHIMTSLRGKQVIQ